MARPMRAHSYNSRFLTGKFPGFSVKRRVAQMRKKDSVVVSGQS
jgi:hypothetical protein